MKNKDNDRKKKNRHKKSENGDRTPYPLLKIYQDHSKDYFKIIRKTQMAQRYKKQKRNQWRIKNKSSRISSPDEMEGFPTPLERASVRRISPIILITFTPV